MTLLPRFLSLVFFLLACFVLPQQAAAQQTPPVVEISFNDDLVQEEGTVFRFTVNLSAALLEARTFNIAYSTFDPSSGIYDPATLATDLGSDRPTTLTIPTGVTEVTFDVPTVQDNIAEKPEVFSVALSVPTPFPTNPRNLLVLDARANNTILDNDSAAIQIFSQRQVEHQGFRFRITTNGARSEKPIPMTWTVTDGTASVVDDLELSSTSGSITLPASVGNAFSQAFLEIPINNDALVESDETFTVTLSPRGAQPAGVVYNPGMARATGTITDSVTFFQLSPAARNPVFEGRWHQFTINLNKPLLRSVHITWTATSGTATVEEDLAETTGQVFLPAGSMGPVSFNVRSVDDTEDEADETFTVTIKPTDTLPFQTFIDPRNDSRTVTLLDNDEAPAVNATVSIDNESVVENVSSGNATFTATLSQAVSSPVVLAVEVTAGTATLGVDLGTDLPDTVTIDANTTEATFTVPITDDNIVEGNETFTVTLSEDDTTELPDDVTIGDGTAIGTITEDDTAEVTLSPDTATAVEDGTFTYTVSLDAAADESVTVRWTATAGPGDTATVADDLQETTGTVTFNADTNADQTFTISPVNDTDDEANETFTVTLGQDTQGNNPLPTGVTIGTNNSSAATIIDNDDAPPPENARVNIVDMTAAEGAGAIGFTVTLSRAVESGVTLAVAYTAGSADPGTDLGTPLPPTVTIPEGETSVTLSVPVIDDDIAEGTETFTVTLSADPANPLPDDVSIGDGVATGTITDNDEAPGTTTGIRIADAAPVAENGIARFTVSLSRAVDSDVTLAVAYTAGSADPGTDLGTPLPTTVTIFEGEISATLTVPIIDDVTVEGEETFTVTVREDPANRLPADVIITDNEATGTITEDDRALISLSPATHQAIEGGSFSYTVRLSAPVDEAITVGWVAGASADDLEETRGSVRFAANDTADKTFTIRPVDDEIDEPNETFTVFIQGSAVGLPAGVRVDYANYYSAATILDESAGVWVSIADATVDENVAGGTVAFTVSLSRAVGSDVTLDVSYADGSATLVDDLLAGWPDRVTIDEGDTSATFFLPVKDDGFVEGDETFTVTIRESRATRLPADVIILDGEATGTIRDDDTGLVSLSPTTAQDGTMITFRVNLTKRLPEDLALGWTATLTPESGPAEDDPLSGTVTVRSSSSSAQFTIDAAGLTPGTLTVRLSDAGLPPGMLLDDSRAMTTHLLSHFGRVSIANADPVEEGAGPALLTVSLDRAVAGDVLLDVNYSATSWRDLGSPLPGGVFIARGETSATLSVPIVDDEIVEGRESFTVTISENPQARLPAGVTIADGRATLTITDEGTDDGSVLVSLSTQTTQEGTVIVFEVNLTNPLEEDLALGWTAIVPPSGRESSDDDPLSGMVTVRAGDIWAPLAIDTAGLPPGELLVVELSAAGLPPDVLLSKDRNRMVAGIPGLGSVSAASAATVSIEDADPVAEDAGTARFMVSLSRAVGDDVVLDVAYGVADAAGSATLADLGSARPATVTIAAGATEATLDVPIVDDGFVEDEETFEVIIANARAAGATEATPDVPTIANARATGTITQTRGHSVLIEPRLIGAGTALRRHAGRFDAMTGTVARNRLEARETRRLSGSKDLGNGAVAVGGKLGESRWGAWVDGAWAGFGGNASGRQADVYGGVDYLAPDGNWLIGALIGHEAAGLDIGEATYRSDFTHFGVYGGARLSEHLLFDGAMSYGLATPDIALGDVSASYDANRITARGALTGDFGFAYGSVKIEPQLGLLYARETLGAFTDSAGGVAGRDILEFGRFSAGPRLTWDFDGVRVEGGARVQWDFLQLEDGVDGRVSAAADIGVTLDLAPGVTLGVQGDVDGIGIGEDFRGFGGKVELKARF